MMQEQVDQYFEENLTPTQEYLIKLSFGLVGEKLDTDQISRKTRLPLREVEMILEQALMEISSNQAVLEWLDGFT